MAINPIKDETLNLFPDNTDGDITASDMREFVNNVWFDKERKINKYPTLQDAFSDSNLYQLDIFLITKEPVQSKNGIYVSLINQPNYENEIVQVANLTKNDVIEVQTYDEMISLNVNKGDICTVQENFQTYIYDGNSWKEFLSDISIQNAIKDDLISDTTLWSSQKILDSIINLSTDHTHTIQEIENLQNILNFLESQINLKATINNPKLTGTVEVFYDIDNDIDAKLRISNSQMFAQPNRFSELNTNNLTIKNDLRDLVIRNNGLEATLEFNHNGQVSEIIKIKSGEAPKTIYPPNSEIDLVNKKYVDDRFLLIPDPSDYATIVYVDNQDAKRVSRYGDTLEGSLTVRYPNSFVGFLVDNTQGLNPLSEWLIGQDDTGKFKVQMSNNSIPENRGLSIDVDSNALELKNDAIYYNNVKIPDEDYISNMDNLLNAKIENRLSVFGDSINFMKGNLKFKETLSKLPTMYFERSNNSIASIYSVDLYTGDTSITISDNAGNIVNTFEIKDNGEAYINGNLIWNENNSGSNSGLDADTLDGMQPNELPTSDDTLTKLSLKLDKSGGTVSGDLDINGNLTTSNLLTNSAAISNLYSTNVKSSRIETDILDIINGGDLTVTGDTVLNNLYVSKIPIFDNNIVIGDNLTTNPKIIFSDSAPGNEPYIEYDKVSQEFRLTNANFLNSMIWHEENLDVFFKNDYINSSNGPQDAGKPVVLNSQGIIDGSMIDMNSFYYVGTFTPGDNGGCDPYSDPFCEYPDTAGETFGALWIVQDLIVNYTFQTGDLAGDTVKNGDFMIWSVSGWSVIESSMDPLLYYKLDGTQAITAPFAGGNQQLKNIADGTDLQDAVTVNQISYFSTFFVPRDGSLDLTNNMDAGGFQLKQVADGTDLQDAVTLNQLNDKLSLDGSDIFTGDLNIGDGNTGGNLIMRSRDDNYNPQTIYQRKDGSDVISFYTKNATDLVLSFYDPDSSNPNTPVSETIFERSGKIIVNAGQINGNLVLQENSSGYSDLIFRRINSTYCGAIQSSNDNLVFNVYSDDGSTITNQMALTRDGNLVVANAKVWKEDNFNPDTKEDDLGNPTEPEQYLTSSTSGYRSWVTPRKTFTDLDDTPNDYTGNAGNMIAVNDTEDGLVIGTPAPNIVRQIEEGDGIKIEFEVPGGYLPGNVDVYLNRIRQIVAPQIDGGDIDATNGHSIIFYNPPANGDIIEITAYQKDSLLVMPNATETYVGGIKVRIDDSINTVYITTNGTNP